MLKSKNILLIIFCFIFLFSSLALAKQYDGPVPTTFNQAPMLDKLVEQGKLPSVEERLPESEDIYVVDPVKQIGKYGGTIRTAVISPTSAGDDGLLTSYLGFVKPNAELNKMVPELVKKVESSPDKTVWTIHMRKGLKWSDGYLFTTDDIDFWYKDVLLNKDLTPIVGKVWKSAGKVMELEIIDKYNFKLKFSESKPFFKNQLFHQTAWSMAAFPKHYLKQFHPDYTSKDKLQKMTEEANFDNWYELFQNKNENVWGRSLNPDRPTLTSYVLVKRTSSRRIFERNPYYWKVDKDGNQLPYIDRIESEITNDKEVIQGKIMSGEIDFCAYYTDIRNYPMYKEYESEGDFKVINWDSGLGNDVLYMLNLTDEDPVLRKIFQDIRFRKALSLAINRQEIDDTIYFGKAEPRQWTLLDSSKYFEPEFATSYIKYDPEKANELLDEMGLKKGSQGYRLRPDGKKLGFTIEFYENETPKAANSELVAEYWKRIGIDVNVKQVSAELQTQRAPANMMDASLWHGDKATDVLFPISAQFFIPQEPGWERTIWPDWGRWFQTNGESGDEPPANIKELYGWWEKMMTEPDDAKRIELGKKILESQAKNLWVIGTIGETPHPVIYSNKLGNIIENGIWAWDSGHAKNMDPEQLYFKE